MLAQKDEKSVENTPSTHDRMLDAALQVFIEHGFKGSTTRVIAQVAGVNEVTLFRHFGSKEVLLQVLLMREFKKAHFIDKMEPTLTGDPIQDLTSIGIEYMKAAQSVQPITKLILTVVPQTKLRDVNQWLPKEGLVKLEAIFKKLGARDPYISAVAFQSFFMRSAILEAALGADPVITMDKATIERFIIILVHGMCYSEAKGGVE